MNGGTKETPFSGIQSLLADVQLPPLPRGRASKDLRERWLQVCEIWLSRGGRKPGTFARTTGVTPRTARRWIAEIDARWRADAQTDAGNIRREQLYREAADVAERAWAVVLAGKHPGWTVGALRVVLESIRRRARLCGIDGHVVDLAAGLDGCSGTQDDSGRDKLATPDGRREPTLADVGREVAKLLSTQVDR